MENLLLDYEQAATILGITSRHLRKLVKAGAFKTVRLGTRVLFRKSDLESSIEKLAAVAC